MDIQWNLYYLKDTIEITSTQRTLCMAPKIDFPIVLIHFSPLKSGQPLYGGQISWYQRVSFIERFNCIHVHACVAAYYYNYNLYNNLYLITQNKRRKEMYSCV